MALNLLAVHDVAEYLLACVCAALDETAAQVDRQPGCPCRACVVPGVAAWDSCDDPCGGPGEGGQLTVNVARIFPSNQFPQPGSDVQGMRGCTPAPTTAVELVVTLLRCAPGPDDSGCPPSCDELSAAARVVHVDAVTVANAVLCCLPGYGGGRRGLRFVVGEQKLVGPQGGCVGVEQRVTVALPGCKCPTQES